MDTLLKVGERKKEMETEKVEVKEKWEIIRCFSYSIQINVNASKFRAINYDKYVVVYPFCVCVHVTSVGRCENVADLCDSRWVGSAVYLWFGSCKTCFCFFLSSHLKMIKCNEARSQQFLIGALLTCMCVCTHTQNYDRFSTGSFHASYMGFGCSVTFIKRVIVFKISFHDANSIIIMILLHLIS